jgi:branched-chain amino acid aminotransferase
LAFRPDQNYNRFNTSAVRMAMPEVPEEIIHEWFNPIVAIRQRMD